MTKEQRAIAAQRLVLNGAQSVMTEFAKITDDVILLQALLGTIEKKSDVDTDVVELTDCMMTALDTVHSKIQEVAERLAEKNGFNIDEIKETIQRMIKGEPKNSDSGDDIGNQFR